MADCEGFSIEEGLVLVAYDEDMLDEEETVEIIQLLSMNLYPPIAHRNYARFDLN